jgi:DNA-binding transcriptional LysR family regulator
MFRWMTIYAVKPGCRIAVFVLAFLKTRRTPWAKPMATHLGINPARVDFVTLRLFCAVANTGSITKGAERSHLALSAASRRLSDFEATTGLTLLERTPQGVALTSAGYVALQHAIRLVQGFEQFSSELTEHSRGSRGHVRLWANMSALTEFLPESLVSFLETYPQIRVEIEEQLSVDIAHAVVDGLADVGVLVEGTPSHGLETTPFGVDELVVACSTAHPLAALTRVSFKQCLQHDFVGLNRGSSLLALVSRAAEWEGKALRVRVQVRSFDAMCQMISANLGIGVLPRAASFPMLAEGALKVLCLDEPWAQRRLVVATKAGTPLTPAAALLAEHLKRSSPCSSLIGNGRKSPSQSGAPKGHAAS